jgi:hypothetical protein
MKYKICPEKNRGFIRLVLIIIAILLILSYFGLNLRSIVNSPTGQANFSYVKEFSLGIWNNYLKKPVTYLWNDVIYKLVWQPAINSIQNINNDSSTTTGQWIKIDHIPN